ncbi:hypothetical protein K3495_g1028 [Podosphaera aphanis]|nr:hypothetical protein K3495_g1028 [Podosphaera aphanis]
MSGEKVNEEQVANLLALLRTDAPPDNKVNLINQVKSGIKQNNVPDNCIMSVFEATRAAMASQQAVIVNAGFTTLSHLLSRLSRQDPKYIAKEAARTLPLVIEKMGDSKEKYRQLATQCLTTFWKKAPMDVERIVKNVGLVSKSSRMKETCMTWIVQTHQDYAMPFKNFVSALMELLEDADGMVRDTARNSVIALFQNAPNGAKSDLKMQLKNYNIRPTIASTIIANLTPVSHVEVTDPITTEVPLRSEFSNTIALKTSARSSSPAPEAMSELIEPLDVNTQRELENIFQEIQPYFEGKESEQNWLKREQSCAKLRRLNAGNSSSEFHDAFLVGIKGILDGILKAVNSLRTSLSKEGCSLVQEITKKAGPSLDPMVEILLQNLIKLCGGTKKISSQQGNITVDIIVSKVSYNLRIMQHIWAACQDKNVQPRTYAAGWLKTLLKKETHHRNHLEHSGGMDLIEKCLKKGLADANPGVRENMRSTYWTFAQVWPIKAENIMTSLDATQQKLLLNAPDNPKAVRETTRPSARPGQGFSKSTSVPPKPSLKETMLAQKRAAIAHRNLPTRPGSAMSSFSPVKNTSSSNHSEVPLVRARHDPTTVSHGGLSVAPMRPTKFRPAARPEVAPRPATAGPYSVRRPGHAPSSSESSTSPLAPARAYKARTPSSSSTSSQKRLPPRPSTSLSSHSSPSRHTTPNKKAPSTGKPSPYQSPAKQKHLAVVDHFSPNRSINNDEELTIIVPPMTGSNHMKNKKVLSADDSSNEQKSTLPRETIKSFENLSLNTDNKENANSDASISTSEVITFKSNSSKLAQNSVSSLSENIVSNEETKQEPRLLNSGIKKVKAQSLDIHGFRKLQEMIRESNANWANNKFGELLSGLFEFLEAPLPLLSPEKRLDVKTQILATIKLMFKKDRDAFRSYVTKGIETLLVTRSAYDSRTHIVSGLELLSNELLSLAEPSSTANIISAHLKMQDTTPLHDSRSLSIGLHMLKELLNTKEGFIPSETLVAEMCSLAVTSLESNESGVRLDAVQLCVALHAKVGEGIFWKALGDMRDDPKSLLTYYIVKHQRELPTSATITA